MDDFNDDDFTFARPAPKPATTTTTTTTTTTPDESAASKKITKQLMPWVEKYRPERLSDVISHASILSTIDKLITTGGMPHLLLHGPPGTGKTSTALAISRQLNGGKESGMVLELNASDERGIDTVRDKIKAFAGSRAALPGVMKLVILDEADSMTKVAQFALRRVMEMYAKTTRFIIIANYVNKIISALQSRCTCFRFGPLDHDSVYKHLEMVCNEEGLEFTAEGLEHVMLLSKGDMRMCLNIMQACKAAYNIVDKPSVYLCTGAPEPEQINKIIQLLLNQNYETVLNGLIDVQIKHGLSLIDIITSLHEQLLRMNLPDGILSFVLIKLSEIEVALTAGCGDRLQLLALIGIFQIAKTMLQQQAE
jgi:replication factor C subunit 3/5